MRIAILAMDDPLYTNDFIKQIIIRMKEDIILYAFITKGNRLTIGKNRSKLEYLLSLFFIMGSFHFSKNVFITIFHKIKLKLNQFGLVKNPTVYGYTKNIGINSIKVQNPNSKKFCDYLIHLDLDLIINQSQCILKKRLLSIPKIGIINRHNALLPKNRGRLTPFWVLFNKEIETGVSIHFVDEGIDSGDIIVQKKFTITTKDNFNSIVKKNYQIAGEAILEALDKLEAGQKDFLENKDEDATYNTTPTLKEAWQFRKERLLHFKSK